MLPIDTSASKHTGLNVLSRTTYMMTPCHHMFHTECLERVSSLYIHIYIYIYIYAQLTVQYIIVDANQIRMSCLQSLSSCLLIVFVLYHTFILLFILYSPPSFFYFLFLFCFACHSFFIFLFRLISCITDTQLFLA